MRPTYRQSLGQENESRACRYLKFKGLALITQNYRCYYGEIDLIMRDRDDIVFVEVRSRTRSDYGYASETINKTKQLKLIKTATHFLQSKRWLYKVNSRFDIVGMQYVDNTWKVEWIKNAFSVE